MERDVKRAGTVILLALGGFLVFAFAAWAGGTAPAPYTGDPATATTNALGGFGRTQGWIVSQGISTIDLLADAQIPATIQSDVESTSTTTNTRWLYVTATCGAGTDCALAASQAICIRLGPATDSLALTCSSVSTSAAVTGGGYITAVGQTVGPIEIRPIQSCTSYDTCHIPLWAKSSSSSAVALHVSMAW